MAFRSPVDIANRGLQHLGASRISDTLGFTEDSKNASAMSFCYDKLRRSELRSSLWKFATRKAVLRPIAADTLVVAPALWSSTTTYRPGAIVTDEANILWVSNFPDNLNLSPGNSYGWDLYAGPLTLQEYDSDLAYFSGELVYTYPGDGTFKVFFSLQNSNEDNPATGTTYDATVTYFKDQVITYLGVPFISLIDLNKAQTPSATPAVWASGTTYTIGQTVYSATDGLIYSSVGNGNIGHDPATDAGVHWTSTGVLKPWTGVFTGGSGSLKWLQVTPIALTDFFISYPVGAGPVEQAATRNVYRLPAGFLREAPQDPKAGSVSYLGGPGGRAYEDWLYEGDFIVSSNSTPIVYRFIADVQDVTAMDDLFCEALAAQMAFVTCEEITQSDTKKKTCASVYKEFMTKARMVNSVETGAVEPPEDDWIATRI